MSCRPRYLHEGRPFQRYQLPKMVASLSISLFILLLLAFTTRQKDGSRAQGGKKAHRKWQGGTEPKARIHTQTLKGLTIFRKEKTENRCVLNSSLWRGGGGGKRRGGGNLPFCLCRNPSPHIARFDFSHRGSQQSGMQMMFIMQMHANQV